MSETGTATIPSLTDRIVPVAVGGTPVAAGFLAAKGAGETAAFVLGEDAIVLAAEDGTTRRVAAHEGGILDVAFAEGRLVTGGDDGRVVATDPDGTATEIAADPKRRWIDRVAVARDGTVAWAAGKQVFATAAKGEPKTLDLPSSAGGLAFLPKGLRLAVAHYNGVSLWFPNAQAKPDVLEWKGSHIGVTVSPDGRFVVSTMQEPALHGWRLADGKHMRMQGYAVKVRAMSWTADGRGLATSGADTLVVWPFATKDGPMGQQPRLLAPSDSLVVAVACHPREAVAAVGWENGMVLLVRLDDGAEILAKPPGGGAVSALAWNAAGSRLAFGTEEGDAGLVAL
ncbi:hypothetical protein A33M_1850 [Rhodovulum sp. PH10]|uniref:WD40 repeat domain-containing protein n=1 Tax=Rhodovulum sp. PH10 TaxID=1187851 RepID=UPI00027C28A8|nr:WD40 repeat domain-containing protein [Rhodovulum sp. PH10]EJW12699.1 hypothetical protein A33M_1850 [Rhodovulum sp. PH10]